MTAKARRYFLDEEFLLETDAARELYHGHAEHLPIIDYHCHLPPAEIAQDKRWNNITQLWLNDDHYKWRAMRASGVAERFCTGDAPDRDKFQRYAAIMPNLLRNPLYHWSHLELVRYFGVRDMLLGPDTGKDIYDTCNTIVRSPEFSARSLLRQSRVEVVCTTDDPIDTLEHHLALRDDTSFPTQVRPTWRPDIALAVDQPPVFNAWIGALEKAADTGVSDLRALLAALRRRHDFFAQAGCRLSDRGLQTLDAKDVTMAEATAVFAKARNGESLLPEEIRSYRSFMLHELAVMDAEKGWTMQIHLGALRNVNSRMVEAVGQAKGYDSIGDDAMAAALGRHFDRLDREDLLPKTIIYNLNPAANEVVASMVGNFQSEGIAGKMQFGAAWWFLDQLDGMTRQLEALSQLGVLRLFVGMVTDSRSFVSYVRHEYFRRLLCNILGGEMERGLLPFDLKLVGDMVRDICYENARRHFNFFEPASSPPALS